MLARLVCRSGRQVAASGRMSLRPTASVAPLSSAAAPAPLTPTSTGPGPVQSRYAVIGAGQIGSAVARGILASGHAVFVHDPSTLNKAALEEDGAVWADSAEAAAVAPPDGLGSVDVVVTAVPAPPHVRAVMEGEGSASEGLIAQLPRGTTWIDHTTMEPDEARRLGAAATAQGIDVLEAPLTGGHALLCAGMMTVLVGGDKEVLARHEALMRCYAKTVLHVGEVGLASVLKLITNQLAATHLVAAAEAVMMAKQSGLDMDAFFDGVRASAGNSYVFETEVPLMFNQTFDPGFFISLHNKDLRQARQAHTSNRTGVAPEDYDKLYRVNVAAEQSYIEAEAKYGPDVGSSSPAKLVQDMAGVSMACPGFDNWTYVIDTVKSGSFGVVHKNIGRDDK